MTLAALVSIALATLVSEDLTCVGCGLLVAAGRLDLATALLGCVVGIYAGDLGLWAAGRLAGAALLRRWPSPRLDSIRAWLDRRGASVFFLARFLPGTRLPLYLLAGFLGGFRRFAGWTLLAVLLWVPAVVLLAAWVGHVPNYLPLLGVAVWLLVVARTRLGRAKLVAAVSRLWRWEFWPSWLFYLPLVPYLAWLSLRHRGATVWTAANPGIEAGGVVGESKAAILARLPADRVIPFVLVPAMAGPRAAFARAEAGQRGWGFPLIIKPDAGERGAGVRLVHDWAAVAAYLADQPAPALVQPYHPGPFEAGVFYYRLPGEANGHILAITDKVFPEVTGDGASTLEELVWAHPRYRMQAAVFLARHDARRGDVLRAGETLRLAVAGNHCQGAMFRDGARLWTPALEAAIDAAAKAFDGFSIGRFDVRYADEGEFRAGRDFAIVELNGVTSEATSLYDPSRSLLSAYRLLFRQWELLYRVGAAWRERGVKSVSVVDLLRLAWRHRRAGGLSD